MKVRTQSVGAKDRVAGDRQMFKRSQVYGRNLDCQHTEVSHCCAEGEGGVGYKH